MSASTDACIEGMIRLANGGIKHFGVAVLILRNAYLRPHRAPKTIPKAGGI
jgi:hypothetical protein